MCWCEFREIVDIGENLIFTTVVSLSHGFQLISTFGRVLALHIEQG